MISLPIDTLQPDFLSLLPSNHLIVEAETGSGKSTRLPLWAAQTGRVLVIEPRRIACTSLAQFLAKQSGQALGKSIGYAIKLDSQFDDNTQVVFVTPGVALRWYSENKLQDFKTVIVDEFHERRWDTDLLVALLKGDANHQLVVTSATIEGEKLAAYMGASRLYAQGRNYHVAIGYRARDSRQLPDIRNLEQRVTQEVSELLDVEGDILVFLPGRKEIAQCMSQLASIDGIIAVPLHASVTNEQREIALSILPQKKVVLATNVAETSLTIPNIVAVIDSGLERRTEQRNGRTTLSLKHISKASAQQRSGRAGRVMDGVCIRLYGEHAALSDVTPPEMHRESLTEAMLASACCGQALDKLDFLNPLPDRSLNQARNILLAMGAVDEDGKVTEHGSRIYPLPIDALYADLVTRMPTRALREAMVDLTAVLATPANLYRLSSSDEARERLEQQEPLGCDAQIAIGVIRGAAFAGVNVDSEVLRESQALAAQMREVFELPQLSVASRYSHAALVEAIAQLHPELVFVRRSKRREAMANGEMEVTLGRESRFLSKYEAALVLDTHSLSGRGVKQTLNLATFTLPIKLTTLSQLGIGEWQQGEVTTLDDQPAIEMNLIYAGRVIERRYELAQGSMAIKPMVEAVKANKLLPGFANVRQKQIEHWKLYVALGLGETEQDISQLTFESWFTEQLTLLELSDISELDLFSDDDFVFEGIPYWEYEEFASAYPFELALGDLNLDVEYHAEKKLVYVVHRDGLRKGYPKRWELPSWKGWRIQYKRASKIVDIK
ncbi:DEAD/DEAH box helicase [Vibrio galatheae]|uniref:DEAD/DEAH box helicase n=1 Tax=Vibrio galatheae TaxID=579748 RepID=A0A0F4NPW1_9VIBR|nr:helicase-related protein [Vibrio galatheae]KJY84883.1 DEAD/DEAH box helicase [Vibrio galatheae]